MKRLKTGLAWVFVLAVGYGVGYGVSLIAGELMTVAGIVVLLFALLLLVGWAW